MARRRNQNRGRNQQLQSAQQIIKNFPLYQQPTQPYLQVSVSVQQQSNTNATNKNNNNTRNTLTNTPVAIINKHLINKNNRSNCRQNPNKTVTASKKTESYGHIYNKYINNNNKNNNNKYNDANNLEINGDVDESGDIKAHLETNADPAKYCATNTTYQMTMSNNSSENFSQNDTNNHNDADVDADNTSNEQRDNNDDDDDTLSDSYSNSAYISSHTLQQNASENKLNNNLNEEQKKYAIITNCSPVIEQNGNVIAPVIAKNDEQNSISNKCSTTIPVNGQFNELTEYDRVHLLLRNTNKCDDVNSPNDMGQKNTKGNNSNTFSSTSPSPSASIRSFRESSQPLLSSSSPIREGYAGNNNQTRGESPSVRVPTITVVDCSSTTGNSQETARSYDSNNTDKDEYYDFENEMPPQQMLNHEQKQQEFSDYNNTAYFGYDNCTVTQKVNSPYGTQRTASPTSMYSRYNYMKLENVEEEDEEQDEEYTQIENDEEGENASRELARNNNNNLDNEFKYSNSNSPERRENQQYLKSTNISIDGNSNSNSEFNFSASFPDSGMGESLSSTLTNSQSYININSVDCNAASTTMKQQQQRQQQQQQNHTQQQHSYLPFVRDGNSTDCDETLMQCDELFLDFAESSDYLDPTASERLVCIESISLPDVVVESTNSNGNSATATSTNNNNINNNFATLSSSLSSSATNSGDIDCDYININGATGAKISSVHFIPIHVEGSSSGGNGSGSCGGSGRSSPRKQSVDDSLVGSSRATIEIIEDATEIQQTPSITRSAKNNCDIIAEKLKTELLEQKAQFNVQLEDAHKNVSNLQTKINEMQVKIEKLEEELSAKTWNVERLQGELNAAQRDDEFVRRKLKLLEDEKTSLRHRYEENEDELKRKYDDLETQYNELQDKYIQTKSLASNLHTQLAKAQTDAEEWREEMEKIRSELEEQITVLKNALENSENERKICADKWQREFEMLRTHNMDREESIMADCEWQLRQMQKKCKEKLDKSESDRRKAIERVELLEDELEERNKEIDDLKIYQAQVNSLRGIIGEQEQSIQNLVTQIDHLKSDLAIANANLAEQIEAVAKIKYHCDNTLYDKERQMIYRIDEVRNEAASFWEDKLYTEMTRLKYELESVYIDERREALNKLQIEHVEELKALTNRYTDNEEELRNELIETQQLLEQKSKEFITLRDKSDSALLETRMHLDRADREFQRAMCQEEERREALESSLREQFEQEKQELEEKFRERLGQVKDEFAKELQINTQELKEEHKRENEKLKAKLIMEKDEALQILTEKHRNKLADLDEKFKDIEQRHSNDLKDLKATYDAEKVALDKRDISNANEIEQLHRKCRCLTNLFEEMRMRYERRDPRPEDLREIAELRARCESQERDLYLLTDRLREMQIQMNELQQNGVECNAMNNKNKKLKQIKKPPPKTIPTNCDVIYEENEERESPPPTQNLINTKNLHNDNNTSEDNNDNEDNDNNKNNNYNGNEKYANTYDVKEQKIIDLNGKIDQSSYEGNTKLLKKSNEDDTHMITAV